MNQRTGQIMTKKLITIRTDDSVRTAYQIMREHKIRHLPVVDQTGQVIGIMSDRDLKRAMVPLASAQRDLGDEDADFFPNHIAQDYMTWPARTVSEENSVKEVTEILLRDKISAVLVSDIHDHVKGIITTDDLLKLLLKFLEKSPDENNKPIKSFIDYYNWSQLHWA